MFIYTNISNIEQPYGVCYNYFRDWDALPFSLVYPQTYSYKLDAKRLKNPHAMYFPSLRGGFPYAIIQVQEKAFEGFCRRVSLTTCIRVRDMRLIYLVYVNDFVISNTVSRGVAREII